MARTIDHVGATKVALVSGGGILSDLVRIVLTELREVAVVQDITFEGVESTAASIRQAHPDVVVWLMDDDAMVAEHPALLGGDEGWAMIALLDDGRRSATWELRPSRTELGPPSYDSLLTALRAATTRS